MTLLPILAFMGATVTSLGSVVVMLLGAAYLCARIGLFEEPDDDKPG